MKIISWDKCDYIKDIDTLEGKCNLISSPVGTVLLDYKTHQKKVKGQHLITQDIKIADKFVIGCRCKKFLKVCLNIPNLKAFMNNMIAFNIYTFKYNVINYDKFLKKFLMTTQPVRNLRYLGYISPPNVAIAIDELQKVINIPDVILPAISFGVKEELIFVVIDKTLPEENTYTDLALSLIKKPVVKNSNV